MQPLLSPKQVAQALRVSESSVKRWCDKGSIATTYTEGGHRRIRMVDLADFVRTNNLVIQDFSPMGLSSNDSTDAALEASQSAMVAALLAGDEGRCNQLVTELYLAKHGVPFICDQVIAQAFHEIGRKWECGEAEVYQERRGCKIAQRILSRLSTLIPVPSTTAPLAIGCSAEGDYYSLGSTMVELIFRDCGWRALSLGENIPLKSLELAIQRDQPKAIWLSCSHLQDRQQFLDDYRRLYQNYHQLVDFIVGGQALDDELLSQMQFSLHGRSMEQLQEYASNIKSD